MSNEQRTAPRFEVELPGLVGTNDDPEYVDMVLQNLSLGGCFITT
ncbi:MAG TPA: PilZ domain-containing protein, partial [Myxococcales bacterium]|nr:PilZ domain-containing protein [Myxococcales bacterium]